ncbi:MAG: hypothetical protein H7296_11790 [Bacteroidia bacterium]|nr:hypothetical protein [Bacteroidia bacterium]
MQKNLSLNTIEDDVYWSKNDDPAKPLTVGDLERQERKNKGPVPDYLYEPVNQTPASDMDNDARAQSAYDAWNIKRGTTTNTATVNTNIPKNQSNVILDDYYDNQDARRFGSQRSYYYNDPYYNSLSTNWGWTSLYSPMVRSGYYNWAPGWNVGFGYSNYAGWGGGMSYGMGWGGMYGGYGMHGGYGMYGQGCGFGYNPYCYNPWGYSYNYGYGYPYYGYGYGYPYYGYGYGHGQGGYNNGYGNDVVTNRPLLRPRNSMGSSGGGPPATSRPRGYVPDAQSSRPASPAGPLPATGLQNNNTRPVTPGENVYTPSRQNPAAANPAGNNRPGGNLVPDGNGRPVYVSPNIRTATEPNNTNNTYSDRPGGDLRPGANGTQVYVPSRSGATYYENNNRQVQPSNDNPNYNNNTNPNYNQPGYRNPSPTYNSPSRSESPTYSNPPSRTYSPAPAYSAPSRSYGGGSGGGGGSSGGGGGSAPRSRPR